MTTVKTPHDLLAAVPFLIGYHPTDSLVLISVKSDSLEMAMRIDFPKNPPEGSYQLLASHLKRDNSEGALIVAYEPADSLAGPEVLHNVADAVASLDIPIRELMLVRNNHWRSLLCSDDKCCPPEGNQIEEFVNSRIAAEQVASGKVLPFSDSEGLTHSISATILAKDLNWNAQVVGFRVDPDANNLNELQRDGAESILLLADFYSQNGFCKDYDLMARVLGRLSEIQVRDFALGCHTDQTINSYWAMWRDLLRIAPPKFVAPVASVFASIAYENGEGALAHRALDRAIEDDPEYSLARLLRRVFSSGWPPSGFAQLRSELHPRVTATIFG
ncbi:MAG: DUF4192 domain-containing protein [Candidatus Nanopelagicaceae bacterium]|nr:DUF4192 domain-containing protein [Candidatus Nanopelagicaceae bacterium]